MVNTVGARDELRALSAWHQPPDDQPGEGEPDRNGSELCRACGEMFPCSTSDNIDIALDGLDAIDRLIPVLAGVPTG